MTIEIDLNRSQTEILLTIFKMVREPDITSVDDYASVIFLDLLYKIWEDVRRDILN